MLQEVIKRHKWEAIPILQGANKDEYERVILNNLGICSRINAFLRMFSADADDAEAKNFERGFIIGIVCAIMAGGDIRNQNDVMADVEIMIAQLSMKDFNIMTGGKLEQLQKPIIRDC